MAGTQSGRPATPGNNVPCFASFEYEWYGSIGMTSNSLPRFNQTGPP